MTGVGKDTFVKGKRSCTVPFFGLFYLLCGLLCLFEFQCFVFNRTILQCHCLRNYYQFDIFGQSFDGTGGRLYNRYISAHQEIPFNLYRYRIGGLCLLYKIHGPAMAASAWSGSGSRIGISLQSVDGCLGQFKLGKLSGIDIQPDLCRWFYWICSDVSDWRILFQTLGMESLFSDTDSFISYDDSISHPASEYQAWQSSKERGGREKFFVCSGVSAIGKKPSFFVIR